MKIIELPRHLKYERFTVKFGNILNNQVTYILREHLCSWYASSCSSIFLFFFFFFFGFAFLDTIFNGFGIVIFGDSF